jgi:hypothetical protein
LYTKINRLLLNDTSIIVQQLLHLLLKTPQAIGNLLLVLFAILTRVNITGTSTSTPTTVARAAPDLNPNKDIATATASSKKLLAPIKDAGAAML